MNDLKVTEKGDISARLLSSAKNHDLVIEYLDAHYSKDQRSSIKALDIPCGAGAVSIRMRDLGFNVSCCDIDPGHFQGKNFEFKQADLNKSIPYKDGEFNLIISVAGLQRLTFPAIALSEFHRVLSDGGALILGLPHYATLRFRMSFLLFGSLGKRFDKPECKQTILNPEANFRFPLSYPYVVNLLKESGFEIVESSCKPEYKWYKFGFLPLSLLLCLISKIRSLGKHYKAYSFSSSIAMQYSRHYLIKAIKRK